MGILAWLALGLIAGALAKLIYPGNQGGGIIATIGLGILGADWLEDTSVKHCLAVREPPPPQ